MSETPKILVPLAEGVEEMEAVILIDMLRRAECTVVAATQNEELITASRGVRLGGDHLLDDVLHDPYDLILIPGGNGGVERLCADRALIGRLKEQAIHEAWMASICAGALVLQKAGILHGRHLTCHPSAKPKLTSGTYVDEPVVVDGKLITSQGPGTAFHFGLELIRQLLGEPASEAVAGPMCLPKSFAG